MRGQCTKCGAIDYVQIVKGKMVCEDCFNAKGGVEVEHEVMRVYFDTEELAEIEKAGGKRRISGILDDIKAEVTKGNKAVLPDNYLDELGQKWQEEDFKEDGQTAFNRKVDL